MGNPPPSEPVGRKSVTLPLSLWDSVNAYRHARRISTEAEAVRLLLRAGLAAEVREGADER